MGTKGVICDCALKVPLSKNPGEARWRVNKLEYGGSAGSEGQMMAFITQQTCPVRTDGLGMYDFPRFFHCFPTVKEVAVTQDFELGLPLAAYHPSAAKISFPLLHVSPFCWHVSSLLEQKSIS